MIIHDGKKLTGLVIDGQKISEVYHGEDKVLGAASKEPLWLCYQYAGGVMYFYVSSTNSSTLLCSSNGYLGYFYFSPRTTSWDSNTYITSTDTREMIALASRAPQYDLYE